MKSVFETSTKEELITRISSVNKQNSAQWGKMNAFQMTKHCTLCEGMFLGEIKIKRAFIGRLLGPMVLKKVLKVTKEQIGFFAYKHADHHLRQFNV